MQLVVCNQKYKKLYERNIAQKLNAEEIKNLETKIDL
jgi:hypothetical protein